MNKELLFDEQALDKIQIGVNKLASIVGATMGPGGSNIMIEKSGPLPFITKDGITVCREITLEDPLENMGVAVVREAASKTVQLAGDGTSSSTVLAQAIFNSGLKVLKDSSNSWWFNKKSKRAIQIDLKRGIDIGVKAIVEEIKSIAQPVKDGDILKIARISSNGDEEIANLIKDAIDQVGRSGIVSVEDTQNLESYTKKVEGTRFERGWLSGYFAADNMRQEWDNSNVEILIYDGAITSYKELHPLFDKLRKTTQKPLLLVAQDVSGEALAAMAMNHAKGLMIACAVQSMDTNHNRNEHLKDLAALTGATIIARETGISLNTADAKVLGTAERVRVSQFTTTIINGGGGDRIAARGKVIEEEMKDANPQAMAMLQYRKARLIDGLAVIYVGGQSDIEIREKKDRIDDSLSATRAALDEGIIPGGGIAYLRALNALKNKWPIVANKDQELGLKIVAKSLLEPFRAIVSNVGENPDKVLKKIQSGFSSWGSNYGFNAKTLQYCDLIEDGVIDPAKVARLALENASSVAGMLLTVKATISNIKPSSK